MKVPPLLPILLILAAAASIAAPSREALATVVLYNRNDPASRDLAKYYADKRRIPFDQVLGLNCAGEEEISRDQYLVTIAAPLRSAFAKRNWWQTGLDSEGKRVVRSSSMRFVAVMRGVPLKIRREQTGAQPAAESGGKTNSQTILTRSNEASVDSELAALFALDAPVAGVLMNPYFRSFKRIFEIPAGQGPLLVCRLDGPSDEIVRSMIDDSIEAEKNGLWGWAYLDARNIRSGGYKEGDDWILEAGKLMRRQGIPVNLDLSPELFPEGYPMTDASVYYGWYTDHAAGPFARPDFRFVPGAVAVHLHSFSASTVRSETQAWVGPLLARGAAATMGNVYEPYLALTVDFSALQDRLMSGFTLAEAAYAAYRGLSWMGIVVGDPLYRPYAKWGDLDGSPADNAWAQYRKAVLDAGGEPAAAADALRRLAETSGNSMFLEALAQAQAADGQIDGALATLDAAMEMERKTSLRFRFTLERIGFLRRASRAEAARAAVSAALEKFSSPDQVAVLGRLAQKLAPKPKDKP